MTALLIQINLVTRSKPPILLYLLSCSVITTDYNSRLLFITFKEGAGNAFFSLTGGHHVTAVHGLSKYRKLSELTESDEWQLLDKIMALHNTTEMNGKYTAQLDFISPGNISP